MNPGEQCKFYNFGDIYADSAVVTSDPSIARAKSVALKSAAVFAAIILPLSC